MEGSWRRHLQLGVIQVMMFPDAPSSDERTIETARQILADDFFGVLVAGRMSREATGAVRKMVQEANASVAISAAPVILGGKHNLASLDEGSRKAAVEDLKKSIDDAYTLGAKVVEVLDGAKSFPGPELEKQATDQLVRTLTELASYAEQKAAAEPIWILLETFDRSVDKQSLVGPSSLAVEVARGVRAKQANFGLTIDMGHLPLIGEGYREALETTKDYLVHAHLGNCIRDDKGHAFYGDSHPAFGLPGGVADVPELAEFIAALQGIGYFEKQGPTGMPWLTFEVKPQPGQSSELMIANCKRTFKEAWARL
ncbi:MAG TPA: TIM barrel protein [Chloroflexota bacterium]|nr:TIM barrel protein [Chloroflexota bacterium]